MEIKQLFLSNVQVSTPFYSNV